MPESRRRKPKRPKQLDRKPKIKERNGVRYMRIKDEYGDWVWRQLPETNKETG